MNKLQFGTAAIAALLVASLAACSAEPATTTDDTQPAQTTPETQTPAEDPAAPAEPYIQEQVDQLTVAEGDPYRYSLAQVGGVTAEGDYLMRVIRDFQPGETIDFRRAELTEEEETGETFLVTPTGQLSYFVREEEQWKQGKLKNLRADQYVYLTREPDTGTVYAITATELATDATDSTDPMDNTDSVDNADETPTDTDGAATP